MAIFLNPMLGILFFRNPYFPSTVAEWNNLDKSKRNSESFSILEIMLKFIRPSPKSSFNCYNLKWVNLLTRLRLGLSHLRDHKFKHSFRDLLNLICNCGTDVETTTHNFLHFRLFSDGRLILIDNIRNMDNNILNLIDSRFLEVLLFGNSSFSNTKNTSILNTTIKHILSSKRFEVPLFDSFWYSCMAALCTSYYFLFLSFLIFIGPFPIIIDLVFTLLYHVTLEYWFLISSLFYLDPRYIDTYVPGGCTFFILNE